MWFESTLTRIRHVGSFQCVSRPSLLQTCVFELLTLTVLCACACWKILSISHIVILACATLTGSRHVWCRKPLAVFKLTIWIRQPSRTWWGSTFATLVRFACSILCLLVNSLVYPQAPRIEIVCLLYYFVVVCLCYLSSYSIHLYRFFGDAWSAHDWGDGMRWACTVQS